jgi:peroxiredoxin
VAVERGGMQDVAARTAFLIEDGETIRAAWMLGRELPDVDAAIAAATRQ